ncbi:MAG: histidine phosphatase family protein [Pseudomonadota bacterium]
MIRLTIALAVLLTAIAARPALAASEEVWSALMSQPAIIFLRHAQTTPGTGDPPNFALDDCSTQRNLGDRGRQQARDFGQALRTAGVQVGKVLTSPWCRSRETAELMAVGPVAESDLIASIWNDRITNPDRSNELRVFIQAWQGPGVLLLVSHGINIRRLLGLGAGQGGGYVLLPDPEVEGGLRVIGRVP